MQATEEMDYETLAEPFEQDIENFLESLPEQDQEKFRSVRDSYDDAKSIRTQNNETRAQFHKVTQEFKRLLRAIEPNEYEAPTFKKWEQMQPHVRTWQRLMDELNIVE